MGLIPSSCRLLIREHRRSNFQGPLLTLGNQDIWASYQDLEGFFRDLGCPYSAAEVRPHTSHHLRSMPAMSRDFVHARTFFEMMGITDYADMDKFDTDNPTILHDLNVPVEADLLDRFNTVIDGGTIEHVFDIRAVMENIVRMCRLGGRVVHLSPASNFVDHGLYSLSPCFFFDFYSANGFDDLVCSVWQVDPKDYFSKCPVFDYRYGMDVEPLIDPRRNTLVFFSARKAAKLDRVVIPTQGVYQPSAAAVRPPTLSVLGQLVPARLRPTAHRVVRGLVGLGEAIVPRYRRLGRI